MFKYGIRPYYFLSRIRVRRHIDRFLHFKGQRPSRLVFFKIRKLSFLNFLIILPSFFLSFSSLPLLNYPRFAFHAFFSIYNYSLVTFYIYFCIWRSALRCFVRPAFLEYKGPTYVPILVRRRKRWPSAQYFLIFKRTRTNNYATFVNKRGEVLYSISAGSLGIKKAWERHRVPTFIRMVDKCLSFVRKRKITRAFACIVTSYNKKHAYTVKARSYKFYMKVLYTRIVPKLVHGLPLRRKRVKRL